VSHWTDALTELHACCSAVTWCRTHPDLATAWATCTRGDWMLWLAGRTGTRREDIVLAACACAREALVYVRNGEDRPRLCLETTEAWARGEATISQVRAARAAAAAASYAAAAAAAASYAASSAAADAARSASLARSADIVRSMLACPVLA
jgi:hypothetical protein